jgi:hypothetical protein
MIKSSDSSSVTHIRDTRDHGAMNVGDVLDVRETMAEPNPIESLRQTDGFSVHERPSGTTVHHVANNPPPSDRVLIDHELVGNSIRLNTRGGGGEVNQAPSPTPVPVHEVDAANGVQISDARIQQIYGSAIEVASQHADQGVGPMAQATWNHVTEQLAAEPGFQDPPGSGNVQWDQVMDYSMGIMSEIFVGGDTTRSGINRTGAEGPLGPILDRLPPVDADHVPDLAHSTEVNEAGNIAVWRSHLNPPGEGIRPEFDDGSGGQMRHTFVYMAIGYNTGAGGLQPSLTHTMGNWTHEALEDGTRQDFIAGQAAWIYGNTLWGAREAAARGDQNDGRNAAANSGMSMSGFFSGTFAPEMSVTYPSPNGPVAITPDVRWSSGSGASGSAVAVAAFDQIMSNGITRNMADNLPWAGTGRENETWFVIQGFYPRE